MKPQSIAVLGGGPGGLYAARLLKTRHPGCQVEVYEQDTPGSTFGFGVGLATRTQRNLDAADPRSLADIVASSWSHGMSMQVDTRRVRLPAGNLLAIGRSTLLNILQRHAQDAGVKIHFGARVSAAELEQDVDLVVAADGIGSVTREAHAQELGARVETDHGYYLWCGTEFALPSAVFSPVRTEAGTFVTHAYPYATDRSTFLVETDATTWARAGFEGTTAETSADGSDEKSLAYLADAFADQLHGHRLIGNRTRWTSFRTVTCKRWHTGRTVLLGDAAHTAHYSIGSGTKLAMEDAITLDQVLAEANTLPEALGRYEAQRRPAVEHLQATARRSMRWWHSFPNRLDLPVEQLFISYMTRTGKVSVERFAETAPDVVRAGLAAYAGGQEPDGSHLDEWIVQQPLARDGWTSANRLLDGRTLPQHELRVDLDEADGTDADALVDLASAAHDDGTAAIVLTCPDDIDAVLTMLEVAERIRRQVGAVVVARAAARHHDHLVAALASGRVDLIDPIPLEQEEA